MSIKNILVHINDEEKASALRLDIAIELAIKHKAHITGLYVIQNVYTPGYVGAYIPSDFQFAQKQAAKENAEKLKAKFESSIKQASCVGEWCCVKGFADYQINLHARYADLIVMGQSDHQKMMSGDKATDDYVLLDSARPILFIPYIGVQAPIGKNIMVAWNGTREAVRAINDAMPFLKRADQVEVVSVNSPAAEGEFPTVDICKYLARHDVKTDASQTVSKGISIANTLLSRASDHNIDLIVMGAYSHSRMRELIFGGVTHDILKQMTIPVLMSH